MEKEETKRKGKRKEQFTAVPVWRQDSGRNNVTQMDMKWYISVYCGDNVTALNNHIHPTVFRAVGSGVREGTSDWCRHSRETCVCPGISGVQLVHSSFMSPLVLVPGSEGLVQEGLIKSYAKASFKSPRRKSPLFTTSTST